MAAARRKTRPPPLAMSMSMGISNVLWVPVDGMSLKLEGKEILADVDWDVQTPGPTGGFAGGIMYSAEDCSELQWTQHSELKVTHWLILAHGSPG